jgi:hypothetical protein
VISFQSAKFVRKVVEVIKLIVVVVDAYDTLMVKNKCVAFSDSVSRLPS